MTRNGFSLALAALVLAGCGATISDPQVGASISVGSNGVSVSPSIGVRIGPVNVGVSP